MIIKLDKETATTECIFYILYYSEDRFKIWYDRRRKVKFMGIKDNKDLYFLDILRLTTWGNWDTLRWHKEQ